MNIQSHLASLTLEQKAAQLSCVFKRELMFTHLKQFNTVTESPSIARRTVFGATTEFR